MATPRSRLTSQGQISIPAEIRRKLGIGPGAVLEWEEEEDGRISVRKAGRYTSEDIHQAVFQDPPAKAIPIEEMDEGIRRYIKSRNARR